MKINSKEWLEKEKRITCITCDKPLAPHKVKYCTSHCKDVYMEKKKRRLLHGNSV